MFLLSDLNIFDSFRNFEILLRASHLKTLIRPPFAWEKIPGYNRGTYKCLNDIPCGDFILSWVNSLKTALNVAV